MRLECAWSGVIHSHDSDYRCLFEVLASGGYSILPLLGEDPWDFSVFLHHTVVLNPATTLTKSTRSGKPRSLSEAISWAVEISHPNSVLRGKSGPPAISKLGTSHWSRLWQRIGTQRFCSLLGNETILIPMAARRCYTQVSGAPIYPPFLKRPRFRPGEIIRDSMFYCVKPRHVIMKRGKTAARSLVCTLFGYSVHHMPKRSHRLVEIFRRTLYNLHLLDCVELLNSTIEFHSDTQPTIGETDQLQVAYMETPTVVAFVRKVITYVFPAEVFGSPSNRQVLMNAIHRFITLRRSENITVHQVIQGVSTKAMTWLGGASNDPHRTVLLQKWVLWMFNDLIVPILREHFYITETEFGKLKVYYYRRLTWEYIARQAFETATIYQKQAEGQHLQHNNVPGELRILPKSTGFRLICNLSSKRHRFTPNMCLRPLYHVLSYELRSNPAALGSSVKGTSDIYLRYSKFVHAWRQKGSPTLYLGSCDIKRCFDSINRTILLEILTSIVSNDKYVLKKYTGSFKKKGEFISRFKTDASNSSFDDYCRYFHDAVLLDQGVEKAYTRSNILSQVERHLMLSSVRYGGALFSQVDGIPQGSIISALLCSIYLGFMESRHLSPMVSSPGFCNMLLRQVDDFLFISENRSDVVKFLEKLHSGIPEMNIVVNKTKTKTNFTVDLNDGSTIGSENIISWCGYIIDPQTMAIRADYTRYTGDGLKNSMNVVGWGTKLLERAKYFLTVRTHALLLDSSTNPRHTVVQNVFEIFAIAAMKACVYILDLSGTSNELLLRVFQKFMDQFWILQKRTICGFQKKVQTCRFPLNKHQTCWLAKRAFVFVVRKHKLFSPALKSLLKDLKKAPYKFIGSDPDLLHISANPSDTLLSINY